MPPLFLSPGERGNCYGAEACHAADDGRLFCRHYAGLCASQYIRADFFFYWLFHMPIPMVIIFMKYGLRQALLLGVTVGFLMGLFIDPVTALVQFLRFWGCRPDLGGGLPL